MVCGDCGSEALEENLFCESCGARLAVAACGCAEVDEEGFCQACGRRVRRPASDHVEVVLSSECAAVSDRGLRHERNEDRVAVAAGEGGLVLVVCDGVSSTRGAEVASGVAAEVLGRRLGEGLCGKDEAEAVMAEAFAAVAEALREQGGGLGEDAASTTAVAAVVRGREITVGWVGDSRAYWVDGAGALALTRDHSWLREAVEGGMPEAEAEAAPQAHAITRWLGADAGEEAGPEMTGMEVTGEGMLLLCTDGLWNYAATEEAMAAVVRGLGEVEAVEVARGLVEFAKGLGGRDNVSVAVWRKAVNSE